MIPRICPSFRTGSLNKGVATSSACSSATHHAERFACGYGHGARRRGPFVRAGNRVLYELEVIRMRKVGNVDIERLDEGLLLGEGAVAPWAIKDAINPTL
jgi:hypothetical protein